MTYAEKIAEEAIMQIEATGVPLEEDDRDLIVNLLVIAAQLGYREGYEVAKAEPRLVS